MKFEDSIQIELNEAYLIGNFEDRYGLNNLKIDKSDNNCEMKCDWCVLKNDPNKIFCLDEDILDEKSYKGKTDQKILNSNLQILNLKEIIRNQLQEIIQNEINKFIDTNINNISYFFEKSKSVDSNTPKFNKIPSFIVVYEVGIDLLKTNSYSIKEKVNMFVKNIKFRDIGNGKIHFGFDRYRNTDDVTYDLKTMKFEESNSELLSKLYSKETLKKFLAYEQYKKAITPDYYNEIAKINRFLQNKKTINVLLKDGTEKKVGAETYNILGKGNIGFKLNVDKDNNIERLRAVKYGRNEVSINANHLQNIDKQLDRLIDLGFDNNLEEELELENE